MANCDSCYNYQYDEEYEEYTCQVNMDEDDYIKSMFQEQKQCPYFQFNDEYKIVRKQM